MVFGFHSCNKTSPDELEVVGKWYFKYIKFKSDKNVPMPPCAPCHKARARSRLRTCTSIIPPALN